MTRFKQRWHSPSGMAMVGCNLHAASVLTERPGAEQQGRLHRRRLSTFCGGKNHCHPDHPSLPCNVWEGAGSCVHAVYRAELQGYILVWVLGVGGGGGEGRALLATVGIARVDSKLPGADIWPRQRTRLDLCGGVHVCIHLDSWGTLPTLRVRGKGGEPFRSRT